MEYLQLTGKEGDSASRGLVEIFLLLLIKLVWPAVLGSEKVEKISKLR